MRHGCLVLLFWMVSIVSVSAQDKAPPPQVRLEELKPNIIYPGAYGGSFTFRLSGENLGVERKDISVDLEGVGPLRLSLEGNCDADPKLTSPCVEIDRNLPGEVLTVRNFPNRFGVARLRVKLAGGSVSNAIPVTFSLVPLSYIRPISLLVLGLLAAIVVLVLVAGQHVGFGAARQLVRYALLLEPQTNTFSLSKLQLLLWTAAAVFAYTYLFLCRSLVQWSLELPPIPDGLPSLLALSVGTAVVGYGITGVRGAKGAGPEGPRLADFISASGTVVGERFQFFLWTIIGVTGFVGIVLMNDPATLTELPKIPDGFLPLMGVSALGYLGGKVARKPGPIVKTLAITSVDDSSHTMTMTLQGENISANATFEIDGQVLRANLAGVTPVKASGSDPNLCNEIQVVFHEADAFTVGSHSLKLMNPDGQSAEATFPLDAMTISVPDLGLTVDGSVPEVQLELAGTHFDDRVRAVWKPVGSKDPRPAEVVAVAEAKIVVKFRPEIRGGKGQLILISATGLKAIADVLVS